MATGVPIPIVPAAVEGFPGPFNPSAIIGAGSSATGESDKDKAMRAEIARLNTLGELYEAYKPLWDFYLAAFEGGPSFTIDAHLSKHQRENDDDFQDRIKRLHYINYCEPLTTFFTDFIYAETIQRSGGTRQEWFTTFTDDVNKKGDSVSSFMPDVCDDMQIFGMAYGLVDAPKLDPNAVLTKADEKEKGIRPYWVLIRPTEIIDWGTDQFDKFIYVRRKQHVCIVDESGNKQDIERFTEFSPKKIKVTDVGRNADNKLVILSASEVENKLGEVPIEVIRYKRSKQFPFMGNSFLRDLAPNNKEVMNLTSLLQEFLYRQCFNILAMEMDTQLPNAQQQDGDAGTSNVLMYPNGAKPPIYITPSSDPANKISDERRTIVAEMYRRAAQDTVNELFNGGGSSGFSKAQSFRTTVPRIASRADSLEKFENAMFTLTYKFMGWTWDGSVKYKDHYEITNLADALSQMSTLFKDLIMPSETFAKEEMVRMVHLFDGKISPDKMKKIYDELNNFNWTEWLDAQKLAFLGRAATSPDIGLALGVPIGTPAAGDVAVNGKDTPTAGSTAKKPTLNSTQVAATSSKQSKK